LLVVGYWLLANALGVRRVMPTLEAKQQLTAAG